MPGAKGRSLEFRPNQVVGLDTRVWQKEGSSTDMLGVVFTLAGEVIKAPGIQPLVRLWALHQPEDRSKAAPTNPFTAKPVAIGALYYGGATEIVVEFDGGIYVLRGNSLELIADGRFKATSVSDATRFIQAGNVLLMLNGEDGNVKWDGVKVTPVGIASQPPTPYAVERIEGQGFTPNINHSFTSYPAGPYMARDFSIERADDATDFYYKMTWTNEYGQESEASAKSIKVSDLQISTTSSPTSENRFVILVTGLSGSAPSDDIDGRFLYRSNDDLAYFQIGFISGVSSDTYWDYTTPETSFSVALEGPGTNLPPPLSRWAFNFRGRTYYGGNRESPNILYYSRSNGGKEAVSANNYIVVYGSGNGDPITGWATSGDYSLIFTRRSTHLLTHDKDDQPILTPISQSIGALSDRSAIGFGDKVFIFSEDGIFAFDGSELQPVSRELSEQVRLLPPAYLKNVFGWSDPKERRVYFSVNSGPGSSNNEVWALHVDTGAVSKIGVSVHGAVNYKGETLVLFTGEDDKTGAAFYDIGVWGTQHSIAGQAYPGRFDTNWFFGKSPQADKTFYRLDVFYVQTASSDMTVNWFTDWDRDLVGTTTFRLSDPSALTWDETFSDGTYRLWDPQVAAHESDVKSWDERRVRCKRIDLSASDATSEALNAKSLKVSFESSGSEDPWRLVGFVLHYEDHGIRTEGTD